MADVFDWIGAPGARFDDPASWFDATLDAPALRAPDLGDSAVFGPGDWTATAGGQVGTLLIEDGATLTVVGTGTETLRATTLTEGVGSALLLEDALLSVNGTLTVGRDAILDLSAAAANPINFPPFGEVSVLAFTLALEGPGDEAGGGRVLLGDNTVELGFLQNGNSGSGNDFDPGLGISGSGRVVLGTIDVPNVIIYDPDLGGFLSAQPLTNLDFGILHVGDTAALHYALTNLSGNAGTTAIGAVQTLVHGGNVTDPALSGSGVTAQDFTIAPRGGTVTYEVALDTAAAGVLQDQAVHIAFQFNRGSFDTGVTLPITGAVLNYADPGFELASGPGSLTEDGTHWTLDLGTIGQGTDPGLIALAVANRAAAPADDLGGSFDLTGAGFEVSGADPFTGLTAGNSLVALTLFVDTTTPGQHAETITLHPIGSNASGFQGSLPDVTLTVTDLIQAAKPEHQPDGHHRGHHPPEHHEAHDHGHGRGPARHDEGGETHAA